MFAQNKIILASAQIWIKDLSRNKIIKSNFSRKCSFSIPRKLPMKLELFFGSRNAQSINYRAFHRVGWAIIETSTPPTIYTCILDAHLMISVCATIFLFLFSMQPQFTSHCTIHIIYILFGGASRHLRGEHIVSTFTPPHKGNCDE